MSYNNDERLITILGLVNDALLGTDRTGHFSKYDDLLEQMDGEKAVVDEILPVLLEKKYIRSMNEKFFQIQGHELDYDAYQITAMGKTYLSSVGSISNSVHIGNIVGSNVAINSESVNQILAKQSDNDQEEIKKLLQKLVNASEKKDRSAILKTLGFIGDKSLDLLIAIIAGGVKL